MDFYKSGESERLKLARQHVYYPTNQNEIRTMSDEHLNLRHWTSFYEEFQLELSVQPVDTFFRKSTGSV